MDKIDIKNLSRKDLENKLRSLGEKSYRVSQVFRWLYKVGVKSFDEMTDLPVELRRMLKAKFRISHLVLLDSRASQLDGTTKYLVKLEDGNAIETVFLPRSQKAMPMGAWMNGFRAGFRSTASRIPKRKKPQPLSRGASPEAERATVCLSSQVGCKFGCAFCASAPFGFVRNLSASEIIDEVLFMTRRNPSPTITNIVFMGIGEPFDNYDNVMKSIRIFNDKDAFNIGARRITISSCGIIPGIERLGEEGLQVVLSISLHSADDKVRSRLVPINKKYPLRDLVKACKDYIAKTDRVITFEYILMKGLNSSAPDALMLSKLLGGIKCKVNIISYNKVVAEGYEAPMEGDVRIFMGILRKNGISVTRRKSKGEDIDAGCGQLRIAML